MTRRLYLAALALVAATALIVRFFLYPSSAPEPIASEAIIVLAGDPALRVPIAVDLAEAGPGVLVVSAPDDYWPASSRNWCEDPGHLTVYCFAPDPETTRGEAEAIGALTAEHDWATITVVTSSYHMTRARLLVSSCTDAEILMAEARPTLSAVSWTAQIAQEVAASARAVIARPC